MTHLINLLPLLERLQEIGGFADVGLADLQPLAVKGLAHEHIEIAGRGLLLRVPRQSQFALAAKDNLSYQAACFRRVGLSGQAPRLHATIEPGETLPLGALLVEKIDGRPPELPRDLEALAVCMARVHALPLPGAADRRPLADHDDPVAGAMVEIEQQAAFLDGAELTDYARAEIEDELSWARGFAESCRGRLQPRSLVLTDTHPGNFLIDRSGKAIIVDLEKALYGAPGTDLAHATIYSSTTWDSDVWADLPIEAVAAFYRAYLACVPPELAERLRPWMVPLRRITMLRAITWCAKWRVLHSSAESCGKSTSNSTENWSAANSPDALVAHVAGRVNEYLQAGILQRMRAEWLGKPSLEDLI
jgi:aminoglycoside phosphotransferase (APT) family kinase protein